MLPIAARFCLLSLICVFCEISVSAQEAAKQPSPVNKYTDVPQSAKNLLTALKKLQIKIEIGINYEAYKTDVESIYPELRLFVESGESKKYPELCFLLSNIGDCHLLVRDKWNTLVSASTDIGRMSPDHFLAFGRPILWKTAAANIAGIAVLLNGSTEEVATFIEKLPNDSCDLMLVSACHAIAKAPKPHSDIDLDHPGTIFDEWGFMPYDFRELSERLEAQAKTSEKAAARWRELNDIVKSNEETLHKWMEEDENRKKREKQQMEDREKQERKKKGSMLDQLNEMLETEKEKPETKKEKEVKRRLAAAKERRQAEEKRRETEEGGKWRKWTAADGVHTIEAKFVSADGEAVYLEKSDHTKIKVAKENISQQDLDWIKHQGWTKPSK